MKHHSSFISIRNKKLLFQRKQPLKYNVMRTLLKLLNLRCNNNDNDKIKISK